MTPLTPSLVPSIRSCSLRSYHFDNSSSETHRSDTFTSFVIVLLYHGNVEFVRAYYKLEVAAVSFLNRGNMEFVVA